MPIGALADAEAFLRAVRASSGSVSSICPRSFLANSPLIGGREGGDEAFPAKLTLVIGGEAVCASALDAWFAEEGRIGRAFSTTYGPTESTVR
ncbi:hypothetical protein [Burkholderia pseudomallei]|uniref:hypothetical protein n=1 Tax=Burkholderia pseudomallei TaxID=28450 RepID=UPI0022EB0224|nr:hypothetical protein [Burkholderia pseudomallei]